MSASHDPTAPGDDDAQAAQTSGWTVDDARPGALAVEVDAAGVGAVPEEARPGRDLEPGADEAAEGPEASEADAAGPDAAGPDAAGPDAAGPDAAGPAVGEQEGPSPDAAEADDLDEAAAPADVGGARGGTEDAAQEDAAAQHADLPSRPVPVAEPVAESVPEPQPGPALEAVPASDAAVASESLPEAPPGSLPAPLSGPEEAGEAEERVGTRGSADASVGGVAEPGPAASASDDDVPPGPADEDAGGLPPADDVEDAPAQPQGWAAVTAAFRPHPATRGQVLAGVLCAVLGFALVVQVHQTNVSGLASLRQADLGQVWARVSGEYTRLEEEAQSLQEAREKLADRDSSRAAAEESARSRIEVLAILAGLAPARGPGLEIRIEDPKARVGAAEILDAVQELRDAGAEALQISGGGYDVRITAATSFVDADGGIRSAGVVLTAPLTLRVIGDPDTLSAALDIPGGVNDVLTDAGARMTLTPRPEVLVDALARTPTYRYSTPASSG
ncbi:MAG: DUF881 domain-containing protein [Kineosporiaceae bacterium]